MNPSNASNAPASATTSKSADTDKPSASRSSGMSESEFLKEQADAAKAAIAEALSELKVDLAKGADPRIWMKSHPWITLATASMAGFAAAAAVVPSKEQQALRKLEAIERALHRARQPQTKSNGDGTEERKGHHGFLGSILHELFGALKPVLLSLITSHFASPGDGTDDVHRGGEVPEGESVR